MIQSSNHLFLAERHKERDFLVASWGNVMPIMFDDYFYPYFHTTSLQLYDDLLFAEGKGTIFLKDGILSLLHFFSRLLKNKNRPKNNFAVPTYMAPIIPSELMDIFVFFDYQTSFQRTHVKRKAFLFLTPLKLHTERECFNNYLTENRDKYDEFLIMRPLLHEDALRILTGTQYDLMVFNEYLECIRSNFSKASINVVTTETLFDIDLMEYEYINSNNYHFYSGEDFLSFYYFFKKGQIPFSRSQTMWADYSLMETKSLTKGHRINFYKFQGDSYLTSREIQILRDEINTERIFIPRNTDKHDDFRLYSSALIELAEQVSKKILSSFI